MKQFLDTGWLLKCVQTYLQVIVRSHLRGITWFNARDPLSAMPERVKKCVIPSNV